MTLYAQWADSYTVTFYANGGTGEMQIQHYGEDESKPLLANGFSRDGYVFVCWNTKPDGSGKNYWNRQKTFITGSISLYAQWFKPTYVDLGLPSGTKWATCNIGATSPEGYGEYFAWGETSPKSNYDWSTYKYCNGSSSTLTKYNTNSSNGTVDNKTTLELSDDAARANWGGKWRMPTQDEYDELINNCTWTWTTQNGVNGYKVTSITNGNSMFLPAAGFRGGSSVHIVGFDGSYWSRSLYVSNPDGAYQLYFGSGGVDWYNYGLREYGLPVRAVCP